MEVDIAPFSAAASGPEWSHAVRTTSAPAFYSNRFLSAISSTPLLSTRLSSFLVLLESGTLIGGIPVFLQASVDPLGLLAPLRADFGDLAPHSGLLSHCWHCYDTRIVSTNAAISSGKLLVEKMRTYASMIGADYFGFVNVSDPFSLDVMRSTGLTPRHMTDRYLMDVSRYATFETYLKHLEPDARRELLRQYRRYGESNAVVAVETADASDLDEVLLLLRATANKYNAEFYYPEQETMALLANLGDTVRLVSVRYCGERVGVFVCFVDPPRLHVWAGGVRYDRTRFSPYAIVMAEAIRFAIQSDGINTVEGGLGNGRIKGKQGFKGQRLYACIDRCHG